MGIPDNQLEQYKIGMQMSKKMAEKVRNGEKLYKWINYHNKFGFSCLEFIRSREATAKYVTKYINKELDTTITEINAHKYFCSQGLNRPVVIREGQFDWLKFELLYKEFTMYDLNIRSSDFNTLVYIDYIPFIAEHIDCLFYS